MRVISSDALHSKLDSPSGQSEVDLVAITCSVREDRTLEYCAERSLAATTHHECMKGP